MHRMILIIALTLIFPCVAIANDAGEILQRIDRAMSQADDITATMELETTKASGEQESRTMTVWQKGDTQRMVKLTAPARLRGVGLLAMADGQLYMYLPAFGRARRVAGRQRGEAFLGSVFTQDDLSRTGFAKRFEARIAEETEEHLMLALTPKEPDEEPYRQILLKVRKADEQVEELTFFEDSEEPRRRIRASDFRDVDGQMLAFRIEAQDLSSNAKSVATLSDVKINTGLADSLFTQRHLTR